MPAAILFQQVFHVFKKLHMPTLVTGDGNTLYIFFNSGFYYFFDRTVMTQMNNFRPFTLHNAAHDVDSGIMTIKQGGGCDDPYVINRGITHKPASL